MWLEALKGSCKLTFLCDGEVGPYKAVLESHPVLYPHMTAQNATLESATGKERDGGITHCLHIPTGTDNVR